MRTTIGTTTVELVDGDIADQDTDAVVTAAHWKLCRRWARMILYWFWSSAWVFFAASVLAQQPGTVRWSVETGGTVVPSPVIGSDGSVYFGVDEGPTDGFGRRFYSISAGGGTNWIFVTGGRGQSSPALGSDGVAYVGCGDGKLYAIAPDGSTNGTVTTGAFESGSPALGADGTIYISINTYTGSFRTNWLSAFRPGGTTNWSVNLGRLVGSPSVSMQMSSPGIGPDGNVYVGSESGTFYSINPAGKTNWVFAVGQSIFSSPAVGDDGTVYFGADDGKVYALDRFGRTQWAYSTGAQIESSPAVALDGTIYAGVFPASPALLALNPDGTRKWWATTSDVSGSPAIAADGTIYIGSYSTYQVSAFSPAGAQLWSFNTGGRIWSSAAVGDDGTVYVGAGTKLYALYGSSSLEMSAWPMFRRGLEHRARAIQRYITGSSWNGTSGFGMTFLVETGRTYSVQVSGDLLGWTELTNFTATNLIVPFVDPSVVAAQRFYRLATARD